LTKGRVAKRALHQKKKKEERRGEHVARDIQKLARLHPGGCLSPTPA
jgi:hypothetical protein